MNQSNYRAVFKVIIPKPNYPATYQTQVFQTIPLDFKPLSAFEMNEKEICVVGTGYETDREFRGHFTVYARGLENPVPVRCSPGYGDFVDSVRGETGDFLYYVFYGMTYEAGEGDAPQ